MLPACHLRVDLGLLASALVEASEIRPHRNDQCAHRVRLRVPRRVLDDAYTWCEDGVMDPSEGTRPWITEDIPARTHPINVARLVLPSTKEAWAEPLGLRPPSVTGAAAWP
jgi:hypothetical protein